LDKVTCCRKCLLAAFTAKAGLCKHYEIFLRQTVLIWSEDQGLRNGT
jgi:hypothetical protein